MGGHTDIHSVATQRAYSRAAGWLYLFNYIAVIFGQTTMSAVRGSGGFAESSARVLASETLYRVALTSMAIGWVSIVILAFALYVVLEPVNRRLAQLALFMRLGESFVGAVTVIMGATATHLRLLAAAPTAGRSIDGQLQALVSAMGSAQGSGFQIAMVFLGVGSILFFYLFHRSRYIPAALAAFGIFASIVMLLVSVAALTFPGYSNVLQIGWAPMFFAEVGTALWLVIRGIRY